MTVRTTDEIFSSLLAQKDIIPELTGLTTSISNEQQLLSQLQTDSNVSVWVLMLYIFAENLQKVEELYKQQIDEVEAIKNQGFIGNKDWYVSKALEFQYGDSVSISGDFEVFYPVVDTTKRIIKSASSEQNGSNYILKVRGRDTDVLTTEQLEAFNAYINKIKFAGTKILIYNRDADILRVQGVVSYNPELPKSSIQPLVESAINTYISNIGFNSQFLTNKLIDSVQGINGVYDFTISSISASSDNGISFTPITNRYKALAGYMKVDTTSQWTLSASIGYNAETI